MSPEPGLLSDFDLKIYYCRVDTTEPDNFTDSLLSKITPGGVKSLKKEDLKKKEYMELHDNIPGYIMVSLENEYEEYDTEFIWEKIKGSKHSEHSVRTQSGGLQCRFLLHEKDMLTEVNLKNSPEVQVVNEEEINKVTDSSLTAPAATCMEVITNKDFYHDTGYKIDIEELFEDLDNCFRDVAGEEKLPYRRNPQDNEEIRKKIYSDG